ncbi:MAG: hypothetical protein COA79_24525 [Planctomycetota bacterium]|nr:MAG: hypothetical protein COA79_24525 [Planctomycetota bacterium]
MLKISSSSADITYCSEKSYRGYLMSECEIVDQLEARLLLLENNKEKYLWINLDVCTLRIAFNMALVEALAIKSMIPKNHIFISCVHTHSGHSCAGMNLLKYVEKISEAYGNLENDLVEVCSIDEIVGQLNKNEIINRRVELTPYLGDLCIMFNDGCEFDQEEKELDVTQLIQNELAKNHQPSSSKRHVADGIVDNRIHQWIFKDKNHKALYNLVRVNSHPVTVSQGKVGKFVSADYIRPLQNKINNLNNASVMILNGAFGNTRPFQKEYSFEAREVIAEAYFQALMRGIKKNSDDVSFSFCESQIKLLLRSDLGNSQNECQALRKELSLDEFSSPKLFEDKKSSYQIFSEMISSKENVILEGNDIDQLCITDKFQKWEIGPIKLFCLPGEPLVELAAEIEDKHNLLVIGLSNGYRSYIPHPSQSGRGGYEANACMYSKESLQAIINAPSTF